ncbi:MAG TPA: hypothetical protein VLZ05_28600 [Mycobacterium sp.]|nr:hypothetical protein [Mycobacterium sp.]HUH72457.1 hypothetical protein [Mycobacterium sp.]
MVIIGAEDGCIPFFKAQTASELSEEVRILSVMISRARHGVVICNASSVPAPLASRRRSVRNSLVFSCARPTNATPSVPVNRARCSWAMSSLRCPLAKSTQASPWSRANRCTALAVRLGGVLR